MDRVIGTVGDVWKHLTLAEILAAARPRWYVEPHARAISSLLTPTLERNYGVYYFLAHAEQSAVLRNSEYYRILDAIRGERGTLRRYPGSSYLAMKVLGPKAEEFLFCDLEEEDLVTIEHHGDRVGISRERIEGLPLDGIRAMRQEMDRWPAEELPRTFVFIDSPRPFHPTESGRSSMDLLCELSGRGVQTLLGYEFNSREEKDLYWREICSSLESYGFHTSTLDLWEAEIVLGVIDDPDYAFVPGLRGAGLLGANLSEDAKEAAIRVGEELARIYAAARLPDGRSGRFLFNPGALPCR